MGLYVGYECCGLKIVKTIAYSDFRKYPSTERSLGASFSESNFNKKNSRIIQLVFYK